MANEHDKRYKKLFSNPVLLQELLQHFVHEDFIKDLDFSTLERLDKSFVTDSFAEKESDLIYKISFDNTEIYIFLLIEFQSSVDKFMALRMLRYICEFYEFLLQKRVRNLPAVFPILLYNGDTPWTAEVSLQNLIEKHIPVQYIPDFRYYPILENEISKDTLINIKNAVSAVFFVENSDIEELRKNFSIIINLLQKEKPEIIILFKNWINNLLGFKDETINDNISDIQEVRTMFSTALKKYGEKIKLEGKLEGKKDVAAKMLSLNFSVTDICAVTGLSKEEVRELGEESS